jgi:hypothetical protein
MKIDDAIAAIKEFFLEVLGFLLPGFTLMLICYLLLRIEYKEVVDGLLKKDYSSTILLTISYILGYVLFGISDAWLSAEKNSKPNWLFRTLRFCKLLNNQTYMQETQEGIKKSQEYKLALEIIHNELGLEKSVLEGMGVNSIRNLAMSYIPEVDRKIYNFMFRSELSDKVALALTITSFFGLVSCFLNACSAFHWLFKSNLDSFLTYLSFIMAAYFLRKTRRRFYDIAMRIAIPIFVVKYKMSGEKKINLNEKA